MPVSRNDHHSQLLATPFSRTMLVTRLGVSVLNVVATIETPISHHGAARPDVKNSAVLVPARLARKTAGRNEITIETATTLQSNGVRVMGRPRGGGSDGADGDGVAQRGQGLARRPEFLGYVVREPAVVQRARLAAPVHL